uniref:Uncharacterized protein n=1 Tax=Pristionchus pacificus TaxID=54126 RepID=A0A2A6CUB1_PRIPA|eukprot:PDM81824.1 hypothetical protein PRIPAC_33978 [Pristionchus pacificus]
MPKDNVQGHRSHRSKGGTGTGNERMEKRGYHGGDPRVAKREGLGKADRSIISDIGTVRL